MPDFCEDDVMNFLVTEAVVEKAALERAEQEGQARERAKRKSFRDAHKEMAAPLGVG